MTMDVNQMKDVFLFSDGHETSEKMLNYIQNVLGITESGIWNYIGYDVISVDPKEYERVLIEGRKFAIEHDYGMYWVDCRNERRAPIASIDIGYGVLPEGLIEGEIEGTDRRGWEYGDNMPSSLREYLTNMKKYFGRNTFKIKVDYSRSENALRITPIAKDIDYEKYKSLLAEYIIENGYGPFEEIYPLTLTGEFVEEAFQKVKQEKKN